MKKSPTAKSSGITEEELKKYTVYSALEISRILQGMMQERQQIQMHFADLPREAVTAILAVDPDRKTLILDALPDPRLDSLAVQTPRLHFNGKQNRIAITFSTGAARSVQFEGAPALEVAFPERLTRLQRREFFRVSVRNSFITVSADGERRVFSVRDVSQTGCCLVDPDKYMADKVGNILADCTLALSGIQELGVTLEVRSSYDVTRPDGRQQRQVGCCFVALESEKAALIQRYVMQVERQSRALTG